MVRQLVPNQLQTHTITRAHFSEFACFDQPRAWKFRPGAKFKDLRTSNAAVQLVIALEEAVSVDGDVSRRERMTINYDGHKENERNEIGCDGDED
jgi:hypothetical protein